MPPADVWRRRLIRLKGLASSNRTGVVALGGLVVFLLREAVLGGRVFFERDLHMQWYGQVESLVRCVSAGAWPLWDPYVSFGQPLLANANNQLYYPPTWLNFVMRPWTYYTLFFAGHLLFSGLGVARLGQRLGLSRAAAHASAAFWIASGPFLSLGNTWNHLAAAAWIPWVLLATDRVSTDGRTRSILAAAAAWALQIVTGSPDMVAMTAALAALCLTRRWNWRHAFDVQNRRMLASGGLTGVGALLLAAGQWLPSLELASQAGRLRLSDAMRTYWSIHPVGLLQTLVPVLWTDLRLDERWHAALFEGREPFLFSIYLGIPAVALATLGLSNVRVNARWSLGAAGLGAVLVSLGHHALFYPLAVRAFPPLRVLRFPAKCLVLTAFCVAMLAGAGIDAWRERVKRKTSLALGGGLVVVAVVLTVLAWQAHFRADVWGPLVLPPLTPGASYAAQLDPGVWKLARGSLLCVVLVALLAARGRGGTRAGASAALVALLGVSDLAWTHRRLNETAPKNLFQLEPEAAAAVDQHDLGRLYVFDYSTSPERSERYLGRRTPYRVPTTLGWGAALGLRMYVFPPIGEAWGLFGSYERDNLGIQPRPLFELGALVDEAAGTAALSRLLRLGAVTQVLALHTTGLPDLEASRTFPPAFVEPIRLYRVPRTLPRTYMVNGVRIADLQAGLATVIDPAFDIRREIVLPSGHPRRPDSSFDGVSRVVDFRADRVRIESDASTPGYVVVVDAYAPGWRAEVDGRPAPLLCANLAFRAVPVPAGRHVIEMTYRPVSVLVGAAISAAALLGTAIVVASSRRESRSRT